MFAFVLKVSIHMVHLYLRTMATKLPFIFCLLWLWLTKVQMFLWSPLILWLPQLLLGHAVAQLVEALRYKSEGRGFDSR
jgi:uncharacterized membrane protein